MKKRLDGKKDSQQRPQMYLEVWQALMQYFSVDTPVDVLDKLDIDICFIPYIGPKERSTPIEVEKNRYMGKCNDSFNNEYNTYY